MIHTFYYCIAGFRMALSGALDAEALLPSFRGFRCAPCDDAQLLFSLTVLPQRPVPMGDAAEVGLFDSDLGHVKLMKAEDKYCIHLKYKDGAVHEMRANPSFTDVQAYICLTDRYAGEALNSLLRIAFSQAILAHGGISIHASAVMRNGRAYLFMGKSGTGKSTHASLWLSSFPGTGLLNDDNPIIRLQGHSAFVYGSPWSGKTPCHRNLRCELGGVARLVQAPTNHLALQESENAFIALLPGCSVVHKDARLYDSLCNTLAELVELVPVGILQCEPNGEAARICAAALLK